MKRATIFAKQKGGEMTEDEAKQKMKYRYFDMDLDEIVSFYIREALNSQLEWTDWFIDPMKGKVIFQRLEDEK